MRLFFQSLAKPFEDAVVACRAHFSSAMLFSAFVNLLYLAPTIYMMQVYDRVVPTGGVLTLLWLTAILTIAIGTLVLLENVRSRLLVRASLNLNRELSGRILDRLVARNRPESSRQAIREFDTLRQMMSGPAFTAMFDIPWIPIYLIAAFMVHPTIGILICVSGAVLVAIAVQNERKSREKSAEANKAQALAYAAQETLFQHAELVRAIGVRKAMTSRQQAAREGAIGSATQAQLSGTRYTAMTKFVRMLMQSLSLGVAAWLAIDGAISVGTIIAASVLLSRALQPLEQLVGAWPQVIQSRLAISSLNSLFEATTGDEERRTLLPNPEGYLELANITLRNPQGTAFLLRGISFWLTPGEVVGLVGPSGAGKSTLARIVAGAIKPDAGEIRIDEANYADWDPEELAQHIGYMPQDSALLPGTIAENISRFAVARGESPQSADARTVDAATKAGIHEMILRLPDGYDALVGGPDFKLSGGQAQRLSLARALYGNPKVLVLDEPSANLDAEGEQGLLQAINIAKMEEAAILLVAHRSSVLSHADRLVILSNGAIERQGARDEVVEALKQRVQPTNVVNMKGR